VVRFFNTVGPRQTGQYGMVVPRFVERALKNEPLLIYGDGRQCRCFGFVGDAFGGERVEGASAGEVLAVMAVETELLDDRPLRCVRIGLRQQKACAAGYCDHAQNCDTEFQLIRNPRAPVSRSGIGCNGGWASQFAGPDAMRSNHSLSSETAFLSRFSARFFGLDYALSY